MEQKKLFAILLGGRTKGCHIELHDLVFAVGPSLEAIYPKLINKWFGSTHKRLYIDASLELDIVDGHRIILTPKGEGIPINMSRQRLHAVNFGGYQAGFFGELHEVNFYIGGSKKDVIKRAKEDLCVGTLQQHCDDNLVIGGTDTEKDIDDIVQICNVDDHIIHLTPTAELSKKTVIAGYLRLDVPDVLAEAKQLRDSAETIA